MDVPRYLLAGKTEAPEEAGSSWATPTEAIFQWWSDRERGTLVKVGGSGMQQVGWALPERRNRGDPRVRAMSARA